MILGEFKRKTLGLIEELNPNSEYLTDDPDISTKFNDVTNQVMHEIVRIKKIPKYVEMDVSAGDIIEFADIEKVCGYEVFQIAKICGVNVAPKANGTIYKMLENGTAEIDCFVYPESITSKTKDSYEFELSTDVLEIMPYGVAADLLKSDVSTGYGRVYAERYADMLSRLDPRFQMTSLYIDGGWDA